VIEHDSFSDPTAAPPGYPMGDDRHLERTENPELHCSPPGLAAATEAMRNQRR